MARFFGAIGFAKTVETEPYVYKEVIEEHNYYGDITRCVRKWESGQNLNDNTNISNNISIMADDYAWRNLHAIRFVRWMGAAWKVSSIEVLRPRLLLTIGDLYNEQTI